MNVWKACNKFLVARVQSKCAMIKMMRCRDHLAKVASMAPDIMVQMVKPKRNTALSVAKVTIQSMDNG